MRSHRPALLSALLCLLASVAPGSVAAGGGAPPTTSSDPVAPTASSAAFLGAGAGTDLVADITGFFAEGDAGATFVPVEPVRLLDTRSGNGLSDRFVSGTPRSVQIAGRGDIPASAVAVTVNVTVTGQTSGGYVTVGPTVGASPSTSTLNFPARDTRANGATVPLDGGGRLAAVFKGAASARIHLVIDVTGYYVMNDGGERFETSEPVRMLDTRSGVGLSDRFTSGVGRAFQVAGRRGIPDDATAVTVNITVTGQTSGGYVTVGPRASGSPTTSTLNFPAGDTRANGATLPLDDRGRLAAIFKGRPGARTHLVVDVTGYFGPGGGSTFVPLEPVRLLDSRSGNGLSHMFASGIPRAFGVAGRGGIPAEAVAVTANVTIVNQTSSGYMSVGLAVSNPPSTSTLNAPIGDTRANNTTLALDGEGRLTALFMGKPGKNYPSYDSRYHDEWEMISAIRDAEVAFPDIVDVFVVGRSYQGRPIWAAKVSDNVANDESEPEVLLDALHHAREHLTIEQILDTFDQLTSRYASDTRIRNIVNSREIWFIFAVNPDGWAYDLNGSTYRGWRKNRQPNAGTTAVGTDLNRNYDYKWGCCGGSSSSKAAWNYRGPAPFSAPETRVMRDFVRGRVKDGRQQIRAHITFHTNGELILYPYGHTFTNVPPDMRVDDQKTFSAIARKMASLNGYTAQQSSDLYITDGDMIDWMYGRYRIFSFTIELYPTETIAKPNDFDPPDEAIAAQNQRNRSAMLYFLERAGCPYGAIGKSC
jgi:hypothetical protein